MQPVPGLPFPSASMGAEWMGSDSEVLDVRVKNVAKESIVVYEVCGLRDVMNLSEEQARSSSPFKLFSVSFCSRRRHSKFVLCLRSFCLLLLFVLDVPLLFYRPCRVHRSVTSPSPDLALQ